MTMIEFLLAVGVAVNGVSIAFLLERVSLMATKAEFDAALTELKGAVDAKIAALEARIAAGGMSAEEEAAVLAEIQAMKAGLTPPV